AIGTKTFMIGKGGNYRPLSLDYTALSGTSTVTAEQTEGIIGGSTPANMTIWGTRYWTLTESGSSSRSYKLTLDGTGFSPTHTVRMIKGNESTNTAYAVTTPNYTNAADFTDFSNFGLGEQEFTTVTTPDDKAACYGAASVNLTATVAPVPTGGTVQFYVDGGMVGSPVPVNTVTGEASYAYNPGTLGFGGHTIRADFSGDGDYLAGSSDPGNNKTLTIYPLPTALITPDGPTTFCSGGSVTLTASGGVSYEWSTTATTAAINVGTSDTYTVTVTDGNGCRNTASQVVTVNPLPSATTTAASDVTVSTANLNGTVNANGSSTAVSFDYGPTIAYGTNVPGVPGPVTGLSPVPVSAVITGLQPATLYHYRVNGTNTCGTTNGDDMTFTTPDIQATTTVQNETIHNSQNTCYNATGTITIAGGGTIFVVEFGGSATMVAGQNILYLPGTAVAEGAYMHGFITLTNEYCGSIPPPMVAVKTGTEENPAASAKPAFRVYPNPTNGSFTIELTGNSLSANANIEIYGIHGDRVMKTNLSGTARKVISLEGQPTGLYFIRMAADGISETGKIIKD
ncbi:MAG: T9SS type A sorting domain-containing protein, partial [Bacteroidales bacterium]